MDHPGENNSAATPGQDAESARSPALLAARDIRKHFGGEYALKGVDFDLRPGEIHGLLGENGAGKSTLIKILAGVQRADAGSITVGGVELPDRFFPEDVRNAGLAFVHQDLGLAEHLSVAENVALAIGYERRGPLISMRATERKVEGILTEVGIDVPPYEPVGALTQDQKVMVAVARAFSLSARAVILDEVSSSLPPPAVAALAESLQSSRKTGVGYVYVTHRLDEVFQSCDRVTVLRDGLKVATAEVENTEPDEVVGWIVGGASSAPRLAAPAAAPRDKEREPTGAVASSHLVIRGLASDGVLEPLDLDVEAGEIVALCGLVGCGAHEAASLLGGGGKPRAGTANLDGQDLPLGSPAKLRAQGCTYVPGDRQAEGGVLGLLVRENLFLSRMRVKSQLDAAFRWPRRERPAADVLTTRLDIRPRSSGDRILSSLSGGNQQKVIFGRALRAQPRLLVVDDPTAGVDIGARQQLHQLLRSAAAEGTVVVMASTDFDEVAGLADRALVLWNGRVHAELSGDSLTADRIAECSYGSGQSNRVTEVRE